MEVLQIPWKGKEQIQAYISPREPKLGSVLTSNLTGTVYEIKKITEYAALLKSMDGKIQVVTDLDNLEIFYVPWNGKGSKRAGP